VVPFEKELYLAYLRLQVFPSVLVRRRKILGLKHAIFNHTEGAFPLGAEPYLFW
jgi:hypothetical protein